MLPTYAMRQYGDYFNFIVFFEDNSSIFSLNWDLTLANVVGFTLLKTI